MMSSKLKLVGILWFFSLRMYAQNTALHAPSELMCDLIENSVHLKVQSVLIGSEKPAFSWQMNDLGNNSFQTAYQILLADNPGFDQPWNSGKTTTEKSSGISYRGPALKPGNAYYWKVRVWNNRGQASVYSSVASFYTAGSLQVYQPPAYPLQMREVKPAVLEKIGQIYRADFGKDAFAQLKLTLNTNQQDSVIIHLGEIVNQDGRINRQPPGTIRYSRYAIKPNKGRHTYTLKINPDVRNTKKGAILMPAYIGEVTPFRYCEIENYAGVLQGDELRQLAVNYFFKDEAANFFSSDSTLNAIWDLCKYSIKATSFTGKYIDGDRERIPYEADAYINQLSDYAVNREYTLARNSSEYLIRNPTWPTEWILQSVLIAWHDYLYTGDIRSVNHYYEDLKAKSLIALKDSTGLVSIKTGKMTPEVMAAIHYSGTLRDIVDWPQNTESDGFVFKPYNAVVNAFHYKALLVLQKLAADLGKKQDALWFEAQARAFKTVYNQSFFDSEKQIYVDGLGTDHASLHSNMFALAFGLVDKEKSAKVLDFIKSKGMACSVYGSQFLLDAVYDAGDADYGFALLTSKTDRSWYNMIRVGSTITLEAWDNKYKPNQDWNHAWGAAPANIISRKLMGIEPLSPGWSEFIVKPQIGNLEFARIKVPTIKGTINADYTQGKSSFHALINIPANTRAQVFLPLKKGRKYQLKMNGKVIKPSVRNETLLISNIGSGKYKFELRFM